MGIPTCGSLPPPAVRRLLGDFLGWVLGSTWPRKYNLMLEILSRPVELGRLGAAMAAWRDAVFDRLGSWAPTWLLETEIAFDLNLLGDGYQICVLVNGVLANTHYVARNDLSVRWS